MFLLSHPARGGWIEIFTISHTATNEAASHPARGGWIEITPAPGLLVQAAGPTPQGVGGLKSAASTVSWGIKRVPPRKGWVD